MSASFGSRFIDVLSHVITIDSDIAADASSVYALSETLDREGRTQEANEINGLIDRIILHKITKEEMWDVAKEVRAGNMDRAREIAEPRMRELPDRGTNQREIAKAIRDRN